MSETNRNRIWTVLALLVAGGLFLVRLGDRGVSSEELRWAQIAREMRASGDLFHPTINGIPYFDKPVGSYWLIVAASFFTGGVDETAARLPSAVAGLIAVMLTISLGRRLVDRPTGILAGAILATSFGVLFYARRASADMETVAGVLAAIWVAEAGLRGESSGLSARGLGGGWRVAMWGIMGATSLTKGLLGFALPVVVLTIHAGWMAWDATRSWRRVIVDQAWLWNRWSLVAIPMSVLLFLTPFVVSTIDSGSTAGWSLLVRENLQRFVAPHNHTGPPYLYVGAIVVLLAPWSLILPTALVGVRRPASRLLTAYFWGVFFFFTLSASRRSYYLLPILPPAAILIARVVLASACDLTTLGRRLRTGAAAVFAIAIAAAGLGLLEPASVLPAPWDRLPPLPERTGYAIGWFVCVALLAWGLHRRRPWRTAAPVAILGFAYVFLVAQPALEALRSRGTFARDVWKCVGQEPLALFRAREIVFDLDSPTPLPEYREVGALLADYHAGRIVHLLVRRRHLDAIEMPTETILEEPVQPWEPTEQSRDRMVLLRTAVQAVARGTD